MIVVVYSIFNFAVQHTFSCTLVTMLGVYAWVKTWLQKNKHSNKLQRWFGQHVQVSVTYLKREKILVIKSLLYCCDNTFWTVCVWFSKIELNSSMDTSIYKSFTSHNNTTFVSPFGNNRPWLIPQQNRYSEIYSDIGEVII